VPEVVGRESVTRLFRLLMNRTWEHTYKIFPLSTGLAHCLIHFWKRTSEEKLTHLLLSLLSFQDVTVAASVIVGLIRHLAFLSNATATCRWDGIAII